VVKSTTKCKAVAANRRRVRTGGGPSTQQKLSVTEQRVMGLMSSVAVHGITTRYDSADTLLSSLSGKQCNISITL